MPDATFALGGPELAAAASAPDLPMREVLARLNRSPDLFQLVIDAGGRLLGTVTDGDIRRALLRGATLDDPAERCMHRTPATGRPGDDAANAVKLAALKSVVPFLPLVDGDGRVTGVLVRRRAATTGPVALVMAGGRGRRLGERTRETPKPLVHVAGKPMIEHVLGRIEAAGTSEIYVSAHYLAEQIEAFCRGRDGIARLTLLRETAPAGTAGAVALLPSTVSGDVLVINGDVLTEIDLRAFAEFHREQGHDASLAAAHHEVQIPYGVVRAEPDGSFHGIEEKPRLRHFVAAGIYLLGPRLRALAPRDRRIDMPDLLNLGREAGLSIGVFPIHEYWRDVGRPDDLEAAEREAPGEAPGARRRREP
jgi:dTDP-glucose pyrophosphorylase